MHLIQQIETELATKTLPDVRVGDTVEVHYLIREGEKERVQLFVGTVIALKGRSVKRSVTVRRIVQGEGVERVFGLHNPRVKDIVTTRRGDVRRAKLYYLRDRVGKKTRLKELLGEKARSAPSAAAQAPAADEPETAPLPGQAVEV
jgi:large subunit ribosomal protein L19